jgi:hypothetical protein
MGGKRRNLWPVLLAAVIVVAVAWVLLVVGHLPEQRRNDLATYGGFALALVIPAAGWIAWAWRSRTRQEGGTVGQEELDRLADLLAEAVGKQWEEAASERGLRWPEPIPVRWEKPSAAMAGPVTAAVGSTRFSPLPGLGTVDQQMLQDGDIRDLHAVYGGLGSGRLVIAGPPGSGKSSAAVLLVLAALTHRDRVRAQDRMQVPVPVLFTAQDWDPRRQPVKEWLTARLQQTYPLFAGRSGAAKAGGLIDAGKVTVILDGLDEIAVELRPVALRVLDRARFRVVVLSRTAEMASAASQRGVLQGAAAVELRVLDPATAAGYLEHVQVDPPPDGWHELINRIRACPASPLAEALNSPLALTLIRDTYQSGDDARELLAHCDMIQQRISGAQAAEEITGHLLDRVLPAAYAPQPGQPPPRYDLQTAQNALTKIAARMNQDGTRDLQWWHIPQWVPPMRRIFLGGLAAWLVVGLVYGLVYGLVPGGDLESGILFGSVIGLVVGVAAGVAARGTSGPPTRMGRLGRPRLRRVLTRSSFKFGLVPGLGGGLAAGVGFGLLLWLQPGPPSNGVVDTLGYVLFGVVFGFLIVFMLFGLAVGLANAFTDPDSTTSPSPATSWRNDRRHTVTIGLVVGLVVGLVAGLVSGLVAGLSHGIASALMFAVLLGLMGFGLVSGLVAGIGISHAWPTTLAAAQLVKRWHTPLRLMNFLDDARSRSVLRTVGPIYQFRHARLQDRLAEQTRTPTPAQDPSKATAV